MAPWKAIGSGTLRSFAAILFSGSLGVGAFLAIGLTVLSPGVLAVGLAGTLAANATALALGLCRTTLSAGQFGYSALLVGLGIGATATLGFEAFLLAGLAGALTALVAGAFRSSLAASFDLPVLTVPFLLVHPLVLGAMPMFGVGMALPLAHEGGGGVVEEALSSLGSLFFVPRVEVGLVVALALLLHSRLSALYLLLGFGVAKGLFAMMAIHPGPGLAPVAEYNAMLVGVAVGAVWFVPSRASVLLAALAAAASTLLSVGLWPWLSLFGFPMLVIPFNCVVVWTLLAMRQRGVGALPLAASPSAENPEQSAAAVAIQAARFGSRYAVRLQAPFLGRWTCTQGIDGETSHQGLWRHAFDFEVLGGDGRPFAGPGKELHDYHCYRLPILAMADGTVVKVQDGVVDNPIGQVNVAENWGNWVVICHGIGLYSLVCHLSPGSLAVVEGQVVTRGQIVGLSGNSGRSPRPHLHVHLQGEPRVGAATLPCELHDVVLGHGAGGEGFVPVAIPTVGDRIRNPQPVADAAQLLGFSYGDVGRYVYTDDRGRTRNEAWTCDLDLFGRWRLCARLAVAGRIEHEHEHEHEHEGPGRTRTLVHDRSAALFTAYEPHGGRAGGLDVLRLALGRVPLELHPGMTWSDTLPRRELYPRVARWCVDLLVPFGVGGGATVRYRVVGGAGLLVVEGESDARTRRNAPRLRTRAVIRPSDGVLEATVIRGGREEHIGRVKPTPKTSENVYEISHLPIADRVCAPVHSSVGTCAWDERAPAAPLDHASAG